MKKRRKAFMDKGFQRCWLASQRGIEPPTPLLGSNFLPILTGVLQCPKSEFFPLFIGKTALFYVV